MGNWPVTTPSYYCKIQLHLIEELQSANFPRVRHSEYAVRQWPPRHMAGAGMQKEGLLAAPSMAFVYICQINFLARGNIASHKMDCFKVPLS